MLEFKRLNVQESIKTVRKTFKKYSILLLVIALIIIIAQYNYFQKKVEASNSDKQKLITQNSEYLESFKAISTNLDDYKENYVNAMAKALLISDAFNVSFEKAQEMYRDSLTDYNKGEESFTKIVDILVANKARQAAPAEQN